MRARGVWWEWARRQGAWCSKHHYTGLQFTLIPSTFEFQPLPFTSFEYLSISKSCAIYYGELGL